MGLGAARNKAIALAKGKYILPLDADNRIHKNYLIEGIKILENDNRVDILFGNAIFFGDTNKIERPGRFNINSILHGNYIDACAIYKKSIWEKTGGYDLNIPRMGNEDWEFWINCFFNGARFSYLDKECFYYRVRNDSMSVTITRPAFIENRNYILKKHVVKIFEYYSFKMNEWDYMKNYYRKHRLKTAANLILRGKI
jgi:glycosyltransferase involved in cell wall biosynthesis